MNKIFAFVIAAAALFCFAGTAYSQFGVGDLLGGIPKLPGIDIGLKDESPITTSFDDAVTSVPFLDDYPVTRVFPVCEMPEGPDGWYLIQPGVYRTEVWSYCLHAGTHGPGKGDGYLLAPLKGKRAKVIQSLLDNSINHPEIAQRDIQVLIWAILSRTKFTDMNREMQVTAAKLLTEKELLELQGGVLGLVPQDMWGKVFGDLPPAVRQIYEAEAKLREMLTTGYSNFEELERVAVLLGDPPDSDDGGIPRGRWSAHPDGYFVRYFPHGYSDMQLEMMVPERCAIARDSKGRIVSVENSRGERLTVAYDDSVARLTFKGSKGAAGHAIKSFTIEYPDRKSPWNLRKKDWQGAFWTITGNPGKGSPENPGSAYPGAASVTKTASAIGGEIDSLMKAAPKGANVGAHKNDLFDLAMLAESFKAAAKFQPQNLQDFYNWPELDFVYELSDFEYNRSVSRDTFEKVGSADDSAAAVKLIYDASADVILRALAPSTYGTYVAWYGGSTARHSIAIAGSQSYPAKIAEKNPLYVAVMYGGGEAWDNRYGADSGYSNFPTNPLYGLGTGAMGFGASQVYQGGRSIPSYRPGGVAAPANRGRQRLALSGRERPGGGGRDRGRDRERDGDRDRDRTRDPNQSPNKGGFDRIRNVMRWFGYGNNAADIVMSGPRGALANQAGMGIPSYGAGVIVDFNINTWETATNALGGDPPDPNFKIPVEAIVPDFPRITTADGVSQELADAMNEYIEASLNASANAKAATVALDRHGGAALAKDAEWIYRHRDAILHFKNKAGFDYLYAADRIENLIAKLKADGVTDIVVTADAMRKYQTRLRNSGWTQAEKDAMRTLGYSDAEMEELRQYRLSVSPEEASGSLMKRSEWLAVALREVGIYLFELPMLEVMGG